MKLPRRIVERPLRQVAKRGMTPLRVLFLIILVGITLEVLTERTREEWRLNRWSQPFAGCATSRAWSAV